MTDDPNKPTPQGDPAAPAQDSPAAKPVVADPAPDTGRTAVQRARRRKRHWAIVAAGAAATAVIGAAWAAISGLLVENGQSYVMASVDRFRRGDEIRQLRAENLTLQGKYDALQASGLHADTAYVPMAFRDSAFCFDQISRWAAEKGYAFTRLATPQHFMARVSYYGVDLQLRCISAKWSNATFLTIAATESQGATMEAARSELASRLAAFTNYPASVSAANGTWSSPGPFFQIGEMVLEMPFSDYALWTAGTVPDRIGVALARPGSTVRVQRRDGFTFFSAGEPGGSVVVRSPVPDEYAVQDEGGAWVPQGDLPGQGSPASGTMVRARVMVGAGGLLFGEDNIDSVNQRYLGDDAAGRLARLPGAINGGQITPIIQNW